jgi:hypothetical protein
VPGVVSVTVNDWPAVIVTGESFAPAPEGWVSQWTLCGAPDWLSWSTNVSVLLTPTTTVNEAGWKFSDWSAPTFCGMTTVSGLPEPLAPLELVELAPEDAGLLVEAEVAVLGVEADDVSVVVPGPGAKRKYAAAPISTMTTTTTITAPTPIPFLPLRPLFIPKKFA